MRCCHGANASTYAAQKGASYATAQSRGRECRGLAGKRAFARTEVIPMWSEIKDEKEKEKALACARGRYQRNLIAGVESLSGSTRDRRYVYVVRVEENGFIGQFIGDTAPSALKVRKVQEEIARAA